MKRLNLKLVLMLGFLFVVSVNAQQPSPTPTPTPVPAPETIRIDAKLDAQAMSGLVSLMERVTSAQLESEVAAKASEAAQARLDTAKQKVIASILAIMANNGLKPKEWSIKGDESGFYVEKIVLPKKPN